MDNSTKTKKAKGRKQSAILKEMTQDELQELIAAAKAELSARPNYLGASRWLLLSSTGLPKDIMDLLARKCCPPNPGDWSDFRGWDEANVGDLAELRPELTRRSGFGAHALREVDALLQAAGLDQKSRRTKTKKE